jgi:hypothetical protein
MTDVVTKAPVMPGGPPLLGTLPALARRGRAPGRCRGQRKVPSHGTLPRRPLGRGAVLVSEASAPAATRKALLASGAEIVVA